MRQVVDQRAARVVLEGCGALHLDALAAGISDGDIIPMTEDLPEPMNEAEFKRRFGDVNGAAYRQMMSDIEHRLAGLALYR